MDPTDCEIGQQEKDGRMLTHDKKDAEFATGRSPSVTKSETLSLRDNVKHCGCGFLMGAADIVPGVSGGTMALIVGVYERLVTAISHFDGRFLQLLASRDVREAARHIDLQFLAGLGCGVLLGAGSLATVIEVLLTDQRTLTYAAFTGMILASSLLVAGQVKSWSLQRIGRLLLAAIAACWLMTLPFVQNPPDSLVYLFFCGMVGICAMILPGISGAFILLMLSRYKTVLEAIRSFVHMEINTGVLVTLVVFALGCGTGLLAFSRVLRKLLTAHRESTIAVLCGLMLGSLYRLWPFQRDLTPDKDLKHKAFEHFMPTSFSAEVWSAAFAAILAGALVLSLDAVARKFQRAQIEGAQR